MFVVFTLVFLGIGAGVYWWIQRSGHTSATAEKTGLENPANPSQEKVTNPMQKYIEVTGIRILTENKKTVVRFLVVNHSTADVPDLAATVTLEASTARSDEDAVGTFSFKADNIPASGSKEFTEALNTKLKPYELPDWQNAVASLQITSPAAQ
ncbi:MAG: hypothetical protein KGN84_22145 [Acidobacteriota bacterium]|nr:hypothetical protein [Acidobacteriota bacterium]